MAKNKQKWIKTLAYWFLTIGAINWGLQEFANFNLVDSLLGVESLLSQTVYGLVTASGVYAIWLLFTKQLK
jgi:uncharacterized membrane protein YuzA (DUF378 family)